MKHRILSCASALFFSLLFFSCSQKQESSLTQLQILLQDESLSEQSRYAVINRITNSLRSSGNSSGMILFLTDWVEKHPSDIYNSYWLLMVASHYLDSGAETVAEYYFDRILKNYPDLLVQGKSVHFICLQHLIQISKNSTNRISYFNQLVNKFPSLVSITEMYVRLAIEYEKTGEFDQALKSYSLFLKQPDAATIQIPGIPEAYSNARKMVNFANSSKDWTFESLQALEDAVKTAIRRYDWRALDRYRSKVNFFAMSWKASETAENALESFSMKGFMVGQRIRYSAKLDESSNRNEAYLRTTGWSPYMPVWYLYFRKVNFPVDPEIHGRWEWAGIYYGEKL